MENLRAFKVETIPATNHLPVRVKITDLRYAKSVIINYSAGSADNEKELVIDCLNMFNINIIAQAWSENKSGQHQYSLYLTDNFTSKI